MTETVEEQRKPGDLAVWDTYYNQANPLVYWDGEQWTYLNISDLSEARRGQVRR